MEKKYSSVPPLTPPPVFRFGPFELHTSSAELRKNDLKIRLQDQPFQILLVLLERPGEVVLREEIRQKLWPNDIVVEFDHSINAAVKRLRDALRDSAENPRYVETVARRGYRFIAKVESASITQAELAVDERPVSIVHPASPRVCTSKLGDEGQSLIETVPKDENRFTARPEESRLEGIPASRPPDSSVRPAVSWRWLTALSAAIATTCGLIWLVQAYRTVESNVSPWASPIRLTSYPGSEIAPTFSPDGSQVAFSWDGASRSNYDIYIKVAGDGEPFRLTSDASEEISPAWSPDGRSVAFLRILSAESAAVYIKPALGGAERRIVDLSQRRSLMSRMRRIAWTPDGKSLVIGGTLTPREEAGLRIVSVSDGTTRILSTPATPNGIDLAPTFDTSGRRLAFVRWDEINRGDVFILDLDQNYSPP